jgi:hypothetical protein
MRAANGRGCIPRVYCHISIALIVLFSTRSLSHVSWGKTRSLPEWRNNPGRPGWYFRE